MASAPPTLPMRPSCRSATTGRSRRARAPAPYMNPYLAGIGLGLVLLAAFVVMGRGLGASGAFNALVAWAVHARGAGARGGQRVPLRLPRRRTSPSAQGLARVRGDRRASPARWSPACWPGASSRWSSAGRARRSACRLALAFSGGAMMAFGAALARGCTSGQALTGGALLNLGSWAFMMMVFAGAYAAASFVRRQWR